MFDFRRITLFYLGYRLGASQSTKLLYMLKILGGMIPESPLATPMLIRSQCLIWA